MNCSSFCIVLRGGGRGCCPRVQIWGFLYSTEQPICKRCKLFKEAVISRVIVKFGSLVLDIQFKRTRIFKFVAILLELLSILLGNLSNDDADGEDDA